MTRAAIAAAALFFAGLIVATPARAGPPQPTPPPTPPPTPQSVDDAERARQAEEAAAKAAAAAAESAGSEAQRLAAARVAEAAALMATEQQTTTLAAQVADLRAKSADAAAAAKAEAARLAPLLPVAERLALYPAETLLTVPAGPEDAVRGVLVLQRMARDVRAAIARLADEQRHAADLAGALEQARAAQAAAAERQRALAALLDRQIEDARARQDAAQFAATDATRRAATAAARAASLRAAIAAIESQQDEAARTETSRPVARGGIQSAAAGAGGVRPRAAIPGSWAVPVIGRVARDFGAADESGPANGTTFATQAGARVVAPCGGQVVFAGLFRSYGQLLILACGDGLHAVLAGLGRIDVALGQGVRTGEPVGVMISSTEAADRPVALYFEVRRGGLAVDPRQYLREKG